MAMKFKLTPYNMQELGQRENQEDSLFPGIGKQTINDRLFILCDGMGGHEKGEVASATVCEAISDYILSRWNPNEELVDGLLQEAIDAAFDALDEKDNGEVKKMGTTMTFLCFHANGVTAAHIGDSRIYQLRPATRKEPARIVWRTRDHSLVEDLIKIGELTEEEAKTHPQKNVITRAMQPCQERRAKADIKHLYDVQSGDYFFMCSDGMLEQATDENILNIITKKDASDERKIEIFRNVTEENKDNHTAHLIYINKVDGKSVIPQAQQPISYDESTRMSQQSNGPQGTWVTPEYPQPKKKKSFLSLIIAAVIIAALAIGASYFLFGGRTDKDKDKKDSTDIKIEMANPTNQGIHNEDIDMEHEDNDTPDANVNTENSGHSSEQVEHDEVPQTVPTNASGVNNVGRTSNPTNGNTVNQKKNNQRKIGDALQKFTKVGAKVNADATKSKDQEATKTTTK